MAIIQAVIKGLKKEIIEAPKESFNNIKAIFNLYRSPKLFNKDFQNDSYSK